MSTFRVLSIAKIMVSGFSIQTHGVGKSVDSIEKK